VQMDIDELVGADPNTWRLADRNLAREVKFPEVGVVFLSGKPGAKLVPRECKSLKPMGASAMRHGNLTCCYVEYEELRDGMWYRHIHGHWATLDGHRVRQCWLVAAK